MPEKASYWDYIRVEQLLDLQRGVDASEQDLSDDEVQARLAFRVAAHHRRCGQHALAEDWFGRAARLAPFDFTVRRAAMPLMDVDPFGEAFFELYGEWQEAGSPYHGLSRPR